MKKMMRILLLSCLRATELIERKFHFSLTWKEKLQLKMHKLMCSACSNFDKQNSLIEESIAKIENKNIVASVELQVLKDSILDKLADRLISH